MSNGNGRVAVIPGAPFGLVRIKELSSGEDNTTLIAIASIDERQKVNAKISHYFGDRWYATVFGNTITPLIISGLAFAEGCATLEDAKTSSKGIDQIRQWYAKNKLSVRADPIEIEIGAETLRGHLLGLSVATKDTATLLHSFDLAFIAVPSPVPVLNK